MGRRDAALHDACRALGRRFHSHPTPEQPVPTRITADPAPLRAFSKGTFLAGLACLKLRGLSPARPERKPVLCVTIPKFWNPRSYRKMAATSSVRRTSNTDF